MKVKTTNTSTIEKDSYVTRTFYWSPGDPLTFTVAYSHKEHERQKLCRRQNQRLRW